MKPRSRYGRKIPLFRVGNLQAHGPDRRSPSDAVDTGRGDGTCDPPDIGVPHPCRGPHRLESWEDVSHPVPALAFAPGLPHASIQPKMSGGCTGSAVSRTQTSECPTPTEELWVRPSLTSLSDQPKCRLSVVQPRRCLGRPTEISPGEETSHIIAGVLFNPTPVRFPRFVVHDSFLPDTAQSLNNRSRSWNLQTVG